jgi:hypothetical protein
MSVTKFAESMSAKNGRNRATALRRQRAVSCAGRIEALEKRQMLSATLTLVNPDNLPGTDRLIFNYIQNPDSSVPNVEHSQQTLEIEDTGSTPLTISSIAINGPWQFVGAPNGGYTNATVNPGTPLDVTLAFTQRTLPAHSYNETNFTSASNGGAAITGALTINSNDAASPSTVVTLAGYWQNQSNNNNEPSLQTITNLLAGYQTNINSTPIPDLTEAISPTSAQYYGSEVVSPSWEAANPGLPVSLQELATFRTEGNTASVYWYGASNQQSHQLYTDVTNQGQTLLPTLSNGSLAAASFTPGGAFGLRVDNEYSSDAINNANGNTGGGGHHFRFFPLVDSSGNTVANTYLVAMDYGVVQAENFDFQDHVWIVSNIRPSGTPETPTGFTAASGVAPVLTWNADFYTPVAYDVYSSSSPTGTFSLLTSTPITTTTYTDTSHPVGPVYYHLTAVDTTQAPVAASVPAVASANIGPSVAPITLSAYSGQAITFNPLTTAVDTSGTLVPSTVTVGTPNHGGTATVTTANGSITYTPASNFTGTETFTYTVSDSNGATATPATVTVTVSTPVAIAPVAANETTTTLENNQVLIPVLNVDTASTSFNVSSVKITVLPKDGAVVANADGTVTYTPSENFVGGDKYAYTVADNNGLTSNVATVNINVGTEISSAKGAAHKVGYYDQDGTFVYITLNKGVADVYFDGIGTVVSTVKGLTSIAGNGLHARLVSLSGTTAASVLKITGSKGGQLTVGGISDASPLGTISAPTANLTSAGNGGISSSSLLTGSLVTEAVQQATPISAAGTVTLAGVKSVSLYSVTDAVLNVGNTGVSSTSVVIKGAVTDSSIISTTPIGTLKAGSWINDNNGSSSESVQVSAPSIGNLVIGGAFDAALSVDSVGKKSALGSVHIAGAVNTASWSVTGNAHSIFLGSAGPTWGGLTVSGNLASFVIAGGNLTADVSAGSINGMKVAGVISANISTTGNLNSLQAGQLVDSLIDVGTTNNNVTTATLANLGTATLGTLRLTSKAANTFSDSSVIAHTIGSATTGAVNAANGGAPEGLAGHLIKGATVTVDGGVLHLNGKDLLSDAALSAFLTTKGATLGTFAIDIL